MCSGDNAELLHEAILLLAVGAGFADQAAIQRTVAG